MSYPKQSKAKALVNPNQLVIANFNTILFKKPVIQEILTRFTNIDRTIVLI